MTVKKMNVRRDRYTGRWEPTDYSFAEVCLGFGKHPNGGLALSDFRDVFSDVNFPQHYPFDDTLYDEHALFGELVSVGDDTGETFAGALATGGACDTGDGLVFNPLYSTDGAVNIQLTGLNGGTLLQFDAHRDVTLVLTGWHTDKRSAFYRACHALGL